ncbi:hypothetical protein SH139x_003395 [Planctomycetaceae bacterium SH139]
MNDPQSDRHDIPSDGLAPAHTAVPKRHFRLKTLLKYLLVSAAFVALAVTLAGNWALKKTQEVPDFYLQATALPENNSAAQSRELESEVEELANRVGQLGGWEATFTEEQVNAWLIHQLPLEFASLLPAGVEEPRVAIRDGKVLVAARYKNPRIETVVSFEVHAQLTPEPNVLAVKINHLKAGALPLPLDRFINHISNRAARSALQIRWDDNEDGDSVALVTVPSEHPSYVRKPVIVESVSIFAGMVRLAGHTGPEARLSYQPRTAVYQLASLRSVKENKTRPDDQNVRNRAL